MQPKCDEDLLYAMPDVFLLSKIAYTIAVALPGGSLGNI